MTSKISFSKLVRLEMKQLAWLTALQAVLFTLLIPFYVLMSMARLTMDRADGVDVDLLQELCNRIGFRRFDLALVVLAMGCICAICAFSYLHAQGKLDFYHSLPVTRGQLFGTKYLAGVLTFVLPYLAAQMLALVIGALYGAASWTVTLEAAIRALQMILFFLCSYAATLIAVMLTGKLLTTVLAVAVFIGYVPMLLFLLFYYLELFLNTWLTPQWLQDSSVALLFKYTSAWAFCISWGNGIEVSKRVGLTGSWPSMAGICQLITIAAVASLISLAVYRKRRTEAAGKALAFGKLESVIKIMLAVPVGLVAALVGAGMFDSGVWVVIFTVLFGTLFCMLMEFIYRWDIRQALMHKWHIAVSVILALLIFGIFRYDILGYDRYLPKKEDVIGMAVKDGSVDGWSFPVDGHWKMYTSEQSEVLDYLETDRVEVLYALAENGVENEKQSRGMQDRYVEHTEWIGLKYHLKNGKEVYRNYAVDRDLYFASMEELLADPQEQERLFPILTVDAEEVVDITGTIYRSKAEEGEPGIPDTDGGEGISVTVPSAEIKEVLTAYQEDLRNLSFEEIYSANSRIYFQMRGQENWWYMNGYPLDERFERTVKVLKGIAAE